MCIRMARRTNSCCSSRPVIKKFPSPLMDLTEAGTVRGMWRPPGVVLLDPQYIRPMFSHVNLCHSSFTGWYLYGQLSKISMSWLSDDRAGDGMGCGEGSNSNCDGLMGEENHPKSQCYGFEQEMAVDEEKVVMVVVMKDRVMVGIAVHWMSC